ncbi:hypothetical protein Bp8pS_309 [Bacillus phage vB_BpuM-BpSp]|nr:hypothetical protein Bp8pS_309 [Bacillus phage vB_BpuM-BpSp]
MLVLDKIAEYLMKKHELDRHTLKLLKETLSFNYNQIKDYQIKIESLDQKLRGVSDVKEEESLLEEFLESPAFN